jgi:hypothetical protein
MLVPSASDVIAIWEEGASCTPLERAAVLLGAACPELNDETRARLPVGRRDGRLLGLRESIFGPQLAGFAECPACGEALEFALDASELRTPEPDAAETYVLSVDGFDVRFRLLTSVDLEAIASFSDDVAGGRMLMERCVLAVRRDGEELAASELPEPVAALLAANVAQQDPQADVVLDVTCLGCGHAWQPLFDIATILWTELAGLARTLIEEVDALASAYGWSEREILALSGRRRRAYLELAG